MRQSAPTPELLLYQQLGWPVQLLGCHFPRGKQHRALWPPLQGMDLPVQALVVDDN